MDLSPLLRAKLGIGRVPPCESTIRRVLQRVDPDVLDEAVSAWLASCSPAKSGRSVFALDGKTSRGARCLDGRAVHLFAAINQVSGVELAGTAGPSPDRVRALRRGGAEPGHRHDQRCPHLLRRPRRFHRCPDQR